MSDFWEAYKHPLWQQMRLRIYERDGFRCQECFARDKTLHAHHKYYLKNHKPWEYSMDAFITLCDECHEQATGGLAEVRQLCGELDSGTRGIVLGYMRAILWLETFGEVKLIVRSHTEAIGVADAYGMTAEQVMNARNDDGTLNIGEMSRVANRRIATKQVAQALDLIDGIEPT